MPEAHRKTLIHLSKTYEDFAAVSLPLPDSIISTLNNSQESRKTMTTSASAATTAAAIEAATTTADPLSVSLNWLHHVLIEDKKIWTRDQTLVTELKGPVR